jgi:spore germination protein GerM
MVVAALVAACGVPTQGPPVSITRVPYDLTKPEPHVVATPTPTGTGRPYVYLVRDELLVPVKASRASSDPSAGVTQVLAQLADGPADQDRSGGLSTALGPDTAFRLVRLQGGVARIDIAPGDQVPSPSRVLLAVAQVVLSVTSVPGVDAVLVSRDGGALELPLPGGALTGAPVTAQDYASLVDAPTPAGSSGPQGAQTAS